MREDDLRTRYWYLPWIPDPEPEQIELSWDRIQERPCDSCEEAVTRYTATDPTA